MTITLDNLNRFLQFLYHFNREKILHATYHITLIVCAPYFVSLNNNTFQLKTVVFFVHLRSQQKRTEKVIPSYLFEVFRALVRSVSGAMCLGLILLALCEVPHSVNILSSARRARTSTTGCSFSESPQNHACSISCLEIP